MPDVEDLRQAPDGWANPEWVAATASRNLPGPNLLPRGPAEANVLRRCVVDIALATKLLNAHLQNRLQLMQSNPTELQDLPFEEAAILLKAMIAAGHADGGLDEGERERLIAIARRGIPDEARRHSLLLAIDAPPALEDVLRAVDTPELAERVYAVSAATLGHGADVNRAYLAYLAARLQLPKDIILRVNAMTSGGEVR
ncbi:DUF533 domain-containing protein [Novosphingobium sp. RD2P27]|uniref:DUF533 domain-containing protein n=1 Tax=Novosphingobium kalidii TaxID=3230299 RepID=A0ABV2D3A2_9SPHN